MSPATSVAILWQECLPAVWQINLKYNALSMLAPMEKLSLVIMSGWSVVLLLPDLLSKVPNVECVETRVPTLNDVFIKYTGRDIREEETEDSGGWAESVHRYTQRGS